MFKYDDIIKLLAYVEKTKSKWDSAGFKSTAGKALNDVSVFIKANILPNIQLCKPFEQGEITRI